MRDRMRLACILMLWPTLLVATPAQTAVTPELLVAQAIAKEDSDPEAARATLAQLVPRLAKGSTRNHAFARLCILTAVADPKSAVPLALDGLADARASADPKAESELLRCAGYAQESLGETAQAAKLYADAVATAELAGDGKVLAEALASRGELRYFSGEYDGSIADLKRAYDLDMSAHQETGQYYVLNAMANLYADANVGEYDKAIAYYREILARHEKLGERGEIATANFNIGSTLERKGELAAALPYYQRAYEIDQSRGDAESVAEEQRVIGALLAKQEKPVQALPWIEKALAYYQKGGDADGVARVRLTRGIALRIAGKPAQAIVDLDASHAYFLPEGNQRFLVRIDEERALALAAMQQWQAAYAALGDQFKAQRELDHKLAEDRTSRLRVQFDAERTEQLNRVLQIENKRRGEALRAAGRERSLQRQVIVLGALLLAVLAVLALRQLWKSRRLRLLALTDELTGLPNRRNVLAFLGQQAHAAHRSGQPLSVVSFDIDHFKRINDTYGHDGGDRALKRMAVLASQAQRGNDRLGRVGGEEFLLVLPGTAATTAAEIAERTRKTIEATPFDEVTPGLHITVSLGVSAWVAGKEAEEAVEVLIKRADEALYRAKEGGRNRVMVA